MAKYRKQEIDEIINSDGDLIGLDTTPVSGSDLESQANNTTDYNAKIGAQPFRYDMLGRFGFSLLPFFEGKEPTEGQTNLSNELIDLMNERYFDILKYYYKKPNKLKPDHRKYVSDGEMSTGVKKHNKEWANKIIRVIQKHFEKAFKAPKNLEETRFVEDKMVEKKTGGDISKKTDKELSDNKLEKIAGLINKLDKKDFDKLFNLLERK